MTKANNNTDTRRARRAAVLLVAVLCFPLTADGGINIVGSSTVYPFSAVAAERFAQITGGKAPKVESTGSGGGLQIFCAGAGASTPDITNASRRIKPSEQKLCTTNNVGGILEVKIGYDGIVIGQSTKADAFALTPRLLFLALARQLPDGNGNFADNPHRQWRDIDPALPALPIRVYGPPPSSGTRDSFVELVMDAGCDTFDEVAALPKEQHKAACRALREDGAFVEAGENDNLIIQKLVASPEALGIFGFGFMDANRAKVRGLSINGVAPGFDSISGGSYPVSRPLYFYAKLSHYASKPSLESFIRFFVSEEVMGEDGFLAERGLIPLPPEEYAAVVKAATEQTPMAEL